MTFDNKLNYKQFILFILPSILVMLTISFYTIVDGYFVSRYVGSDALAAINISIPLYTLAFAVGIMFSSGGGALISIKLGEKNIIAASKFVSNLLTVGFIIGIITASIALIFHGQIVQLLGSNVTLTPYVTTYSFFMILSLPILILKVLGEGFLRSEGKPNRALYICQS